MLDRLRAAGHRITPQRVAILTILAASHGHPTVEQVHARVIQDHPSISLATVYKTITLLKQAGDVLELEFSELSNRYDGANPHPHPHLICTKCDEIMDPDDHDVSAMVQRIAAETGYVISSHRLDFYGICPSCQHAMKK